MKIYAARRRISTSRFAVERVWKYVRRAVNVASMLESICATLVILGVVRGACVTTTNLWSVWTVQRRVDRFLGSLP